MFDKDDKLIDFISSKEEGSIPPKETVPYKFFAPMADNEGFDHYILSFGGIMGMDNLTTGKNLVYEELLDKLERDYHLNETQLYNICTNTDAPPEYAEVAKEFCDYLSKKRGVPYEENNTKFPQELYDECVSAAGREFCDFLFKVNR